MTIKTATKLAIIGTSINMILTLLYPFLGVGMAFGRNLYTLWWILQTVSLNAPLIIFFIVLYRKQN